jgi:hypothetical protein
MGTGAVIYLILIGTICFCVVVILLAIALSAIQGLEALVRVAKWLSWVTLICIAGLDVLHIIT